MVLRLRTLICTRRVKTPMYQQRIACWLSNTVVQGFSSIAILWISENFVNEYFAPFLFFICILHGCTRCSYSDYTSWKIKVNNFETWWWKRSNEPKAKMVYALKKRHYITNLLLRIAFESHFSARLARENRSFLRL